MSLNQPGEAPTLPNIQGIVLYPIAPYLVIVVVVVVVGCFHWGAHFHAKLNSRPRSVRDEESIQRSASPPEASGGSLLLAIVHLYRVLAFRTTVGFGTYVSNLAEVFVTVGYVAVLLVWTFAIEYDPDNDPLNWCSRAALLAASQFPLITILGTKNNIISMVTRISADKLNIIHRMAARACLIFIGIHIIGGQKNFSFYYAGRSSNYTTYGIIAASVFAALVVFSLRPIRERAYELFLCFHFVAVVVILATVIMHIQSFSGASFTYYIWPSFVIWAIDRFIRACRVIYINLACLGIRQKSGTLDATTELLSDTLVRVRCRRPNDVRWSPGQFAYLAIPSVSRLPFETHPFSIASVDSALFVPDARGAEGTSGKELVFFIGVKSGFTRRLRDVAARGEKVNVFIDGPYGVGLNLGCYNTSVLVAGGTGITFALPALLHVIESVRNGSSRCRRVVLVWSIRDANFLNWVSESFYKAMRFAPPDLKVDIQVFLTGGAVRPPSAVPRRQADLGDSLSTLSEDQNTFQDPANPSGKPEGDIFPAPWLKVTSGRPNLEHVVMEEINATSGKMFVGVCGPGAMAQVVRKALRMPWSSPSNPLNGGPSVTLHVESFGYA